MAENWKTETGGQACGASLWVTEIENQKERKSENVHDKFKEKELGSHK